MPSTVILSGPLFDARGQVDMRHICNEIEVDVARAGQTMVHSHLVQFIRHPTPYYWTKVETRANPAGPGRSIWDSFVVYGPWLEGVGSRNRTTRFKGYHAFQIEASLLQRKAGDIAERTVTRLVGELNQ
jgi:hypothetical protein